MRTMSFPDILQQIDRIFAKSQSLLEVKDYLDSLNLSPENVCLSQLINGDQPVNFQVYFLNAERVENLPTSCVVRLRCMVQDIFDPEYFPSRFFEENTETGERIACTMKYRDSRPPGNHTIASEMQESLDSRITLSATSLSFVLYIRWRPFAAAQNVCSRPGRNKVGLRGPSFTHLAHSSHLLRVYYSCPSSPLH